MLEEFQFQLLRQLHLSPDSVVFDPNMDRHHHLIDEESGHIYDVPWEDVEVSNIDDVPDYEVRDYQVVMLGRRRRKRAH